MKKLIYPVLAVVLLSCNNTNAQKEKRVEKQMNVNVNVREDEDSNEENRHSDDSFNGKYESHREVIQKEFTVSTNAFLNVHNIFGDVKVEGYNGNKVIVEVEKIIKAEDKADVELGVKEAKLAFDQIGDTLTFYTSEPYDTRPRKKLSYDWGNEKHRRDYIVHLNYTIKVPRSIGLQLSTVNSGKVEASDIDGRIKANNVNGGITLTNVRAAHDVHSINGNVLINFLASPPENSKFYTLNGKLDITFPKDFSADCEFKSFNGNFYTDFDDIENLPAKTEKQVKNNENGTTYKLNNINS